MEEHGCDLNHKLWSAKLLIDQPEAIIDAHLAYLLSGAQCIITSSYQASIPGFMSLKYSHEKAASFITRSVTLAEEAVDRFLQKATVDYRPLIAASIGPYGAYLADGLEYRGDYRVEDKVLFDYHLSRIEILDETNADFFACETMPSFREVTILSEILKDSRKAAWVSFSCQDDEHINDGTRFGECVSLLSDHPNIFCHWCELHSPGLYSWIDRDRKEECAL